MKPASNLASLTWLFALTMLLSAALLFFVQPLFAKMVLPRFGGSPAVWNTCLVFFQGLLLAGYAYAHLVNAWLDVRRQVLLQAAVLLLPLATLPITADRGWQPLDAANPVLQLLGLLTLAVGLPVFVVSTSAPLLQSWFARSRHPAARDPYFLYAASNLGSLGILVAYPMLMEPALSVHGQSVLWAWGYVALVVLVLVCGVRVWHPHEGNVANGLDRVHKSASSSTVTMWTRLRWAVLALVPSSLLLSVTLYLTADIASLPLLWVIPLALYLLTFVLAFGRRQLLPHAAMARIMPLFMIGLVLLLACEATQPVWLVMLLHLAAFFVTAMVCHGELAHSRPPAEKLTEFYLWLSAGGVVGGLLTALVAPLVFRSVAEYPLALVAACLLRPGPVRAVTQVSRLPSVFRLGSRVAPGYFDVLLPAALGLFTLMLTMASVHLALPGPQQIAVAFGLPLAICYLFLFRPVRFGLGIAALLLVAQFRTGVHGSVLHSERSFFGIHRVTLDPTGDFYQLVNGSTVHGMQRLDAQEQSSSASTGDPSAISPKPEPLTYYHQSGPIGQVLSLPRLVAAKPPMAVVGLGAGSLASYATAGQELDFYEIDPAVKRIAEDDRFFTFLKHCPAEWHTIMGDARLKLADSPRGRYGLIVIDAFSSDAVPLHLITREALELYLDKLATGGLVACNVSSRYLELRPVLANLARACNLVCLARADLLVTSQERRLGKSPSIWVVLARQDEDLESLAQDPRWERLSGSTETALWTDDYANILGALKWE